MSDHKAMPVPGYTDQSDERLQVVRRNKEFEERLLRICDEMMARADLYDGRWMRIAVTHFEQGFMAMNRAVFKPQRAKLPEDN